MPKNKISLDRIMKMVLTLQIIKILLNQFAFK